MFLTKMTEGRSYENTFLEVVPSESMSVKCQLEEGAHFGPIIELLYIILDVVLWHICKIRLEFITFFDG